MGLESTEVHTNTSPNETRLKSAIMEFYKTFCRGMLNSSDLGLIGECFRISNTFAFCSQIKWAEIYKMVDRGDPESDLGLHFLSSFLWQAPSVRNCR